MRVIFLAALLLVVSSAWAAAPTPPPRFAFQPGQRLVYEVRQEVQVLEKAQKSGAKLEGR